MEFNVPLDNDTVHFEDEPFQAIICTGTDNQSHTNREQDAQLSQRDRAAGCVIVFAKSRRLELEDNDLRTL